MIGIHFVSASYSEIAEDNFALTNNAELEVTIFPNPFSGNQLTIEANRNFESVEILDIVGKVIYFKEFESAIIKVEINLSGTDKGLYIVRIKFDSKNFHTEKIIVK